MTWYTRPNNSTGDSLTNIGALALIGGYDCASHVRACQVPSGRMYRHPDLKAKHEVCCAGTTTCGDHGGTLSRDHTVSLIFYTLYSGDKEPLRKFFWFTIRNFGQHSGGTIGQRMQNVQSYAAMLLALGDAYYIFGLLLSLLALPVLYLSAKKLDIGYRLVMVAEYALLYWLTYPKWFRPTLKGLPIICYKRQPTNLYYEVVTAMCEGRNPSYLTPLANQISWNQALHGVDESWYFTNPDDGRKGTGIEGQYILALIKDYERFKG